ncbi:hypothetical protein MCOR25_009581 [Pyricularia grisea]|nr:hypothetical protein MCOR25_009581 [Pyricularia grisea]
MLAGVNLVAVVAEPRLSPEEVPKNHAALASTFLSQPLSARSQSCRWGESNFKKPLVTPMQEHGLAYFTAPLQTLA